MGYKLKESDMFLPIKQFFEEEGYSVYAEVPCWGKTADIVAVKGKLVVVVETKLTMNIKLLEQVFNWQHKAHYVYAAVPQKAELTVWTRELLRNAGIGIICLDIDTTSDEFYCSRVYKYVPARLYRKIGVKLPGELRPMRWDQHILPEHSQNISGVRQADIRVSRYKLMMKHVKRILSLKKEKGISIDELTEALDIHYANPKTGLYNALKKYESDWCELFKKPGDRKSYARFKT